MKKTLTFLVLLSFIISINISQAQIKVFTGTEHGTYYELANDMNALLPSNTADSTETVPFLAPKTTTGSALNFDLLSDPENEAKVAFMQLDLLLLKKAEDMLNGTSFTKDLVVLMPLNVEAIHLITKEKSSINSLATLSGAKVIIGNQKEGTYFTATYIQNVSKVDWLSKNIGTQDAIKPLMLDKVNAFFMVATYPMDLLETLPTQTGVKYKLVSLENINGWADIYTPITIPAGTYHWQKTDVSTYGVPSVVVVNTAKITESEKQQLLQWKALTIENLETLKIKGSPVWKTATINNWDSSIWPQL